MVASGGQLSPVIIWDMKNGSMLKSIPNKTEVTYCVEWSKDGKYLATTEMNGTLNVYDGKTFELLASAPGTDPVDTRAYGCDLNFGHMPGRIFVATEAKFINEYEFKDNTLTLRKKHFAHFDAVKSLTLDGERKRLLSTGRDGSVRLWDCLTDLKPVASLVGHQDNVVIFSSYLGKSSFYSWCYACCLRILGPEHQYLENCLMKLLSSELI